MTLGGSRCCVGLVCEVETNERHSRLASRRSLIGHCGDAHVIVRLPASRTLERPINKRKQINNAAYNHFCGGKETRMPTPVAERSKERSYGRWLAGIAGSSPARGMEVCLL